MVDRWAAIRLAILTGLVALSVGMLLGVRGGELEALHSCGIAAVGGR
ncbi:hypothetical protein GS501_02505 [Saccharibacter sp. 17.LH.SD]|nr:hypothetical protein [Saccharibacter sp. 17.LH.SD]MXV43924.1 hypothetical protein [Saccharibacter sp. 17.LH.SD]